MDSLGLDAFVRYEMPGKGQNSRLEDERHNPR